ncbi:hypothetical protein HAX54_037390, partial [Datura stramonium]|nr:hypothetical protein [Datura stramonium]
LAECLMKRRMRYKASGHCLRLACHRCSTGQDRRNVGVASDDPVSPNPLCKTYGYSTPRGSSPTFYR